MKRFEIYNAVSGIFMGDFYAATGEQALLMLALENGYESIDDMERFIDRDDLLIREMKGADRRRAK